MVKFQTWSIIDYHCQIIELYRMLCFIVILYHDWQSMTITGHEPVGLCGFHTVSMLKLIPWSLTSGSNCSLILYLMHKTSFPPELPIILIFSNFITRKLQKHHCLKSDSNSLSFLWRLGTHTSRIDIKVCLKCWCISFLCAKNTCCTDVVQMETIQRQHSGQQTY